MIRLAFSTNAFKKNTLDEAITAIADAGYRGVEIMADLPHAYPATFTAADRVQLRNRLSDLKLIVSNINAFTLFAKGDTYHPTWIEDDAALRQSRINHTLASIELAADLGSTTVSLQPGGPLLGTGLSAVEAAGRFADGIKQLLPLAHDRKIILAIEPEPGLLIQTSQEYLAFKRAYFADEDSVKMNCDVGHLFCVGEDPGAVIAQMPAQVAHVHLEDIGANRVHQHLAPGRGVIDFESIFAALTRIAYTGWVTVELYPYESSAAAVAGAALAFLSRWTRDS